MSEGKNLKFPNNYKKKEIKIKIPIGFPSTNDPS